ncbi:MAG: alpha-glucuronidase [Gorillibacterium sp.]|nr:alpha-glucuronidase [Gorillibacterium sp.]
MIADRSYSCWLHSEEINDPTIRSYYMDRCTEIVSIGQSSLLQSAVNELRSGIFSMLGVNPSHTDQPQGSHYILVSNLTDLAATEWAIDAETDSSLGEEGYVLRTCEVEGRHGIIVAGKKDRSVLYAAFHLLRLLRSGQRLETLDIREIPANGLRMINQWDNMDGSIERGYAGKSIFYEGNHVTTDLTRVRDYARLLASVGINAIAVNNVNVHEVETRLITDLLPEVAGLAAVFRSYGIQLFLSINYASPVQIGGLATADPLDPGVKQWWAAVADHIYQTIPDFGGFLVKADSEYRPGPFTYGRDHADGANMLAEALEPYGGLVIWRCFVYNCLQDWRDRSTDRAKAAYDTYTQHDGQFRKNVILQIKNGPMDFQVREPVSPLFGGMTATNQMLELQITQEYTGQQRHLCYLVPQWKEILEFDTYAEEQGSTIADIASGSLYGRPLGGIVAVSNIGNDTNWTGHLLAQANLYGFGRLTWNPRLTSEEITREWIELTFGVAPQVVATVSRMLLNSWSIYENYTAPLGVGWMVNSGHHYGPNVDGYEYSKWGTYHFADCHGIGVDRTIRSGTGYAGQYHSLNAEAYESIEACPDELLLFFHHVPYTHQLKSGKTVIQHIYDSHFAGASQAQELIEAWRTLQGKLDENQHQQVSMRLEAQAEHAKEWRDLINTYFYRKSGIPDAENRTIY